MSIFKMAVIGEEDLIRGFGLLGLDLFPVSTGKEARDLLYGLKDDREYGVIFITESIAQGFTEEIEEWGSRPLCFGENQAYCGEGGRCGYPKGKRGR